ncbi:putative RING/FYVE/PHD zinc finger superfamily protein [Melia azedarach]|uniref:RING/FYVE/PHD zinc finger superfamily protein n=1 Tax=Melia azedarach TaxID=155640 RepID=A0ACC1WXF4_MELAZ|nr:putative RING/FYVE/PHD zinc finger superfamily protein [Melia azedarach]
MGSSGAVVNALEACNEQEIGEPMGQNDPGSSGNSSHLVDVVVLETVILVHSDQTACFSRGVKSNELGSSKALVENLNGKVSETEKESCVIDVKCGNGDGKEFKESSDGERVCRICHLSSEQPPETAPTTNATSGATSELIRLGCGCKDELGIAHSHCAEAWFKLKGNRLCEICGQTAKNITGVGDCRFMEEWNERRFIGGNSPSERGGCWRGQPFCNFLMACLVIAFVLPWFFRVNMF